MKITRTQLSELIKDEIENFQSVAEAVQVKRQSGRGMSWVNYDEGNLRLQVTKYGNTYGANFYKIGGSSQPSWKLELKDLSKKDATALGKIVRSKGVKVTAKAAKSKYKKNISEGKLSEDYKNNEWEVYLKDEKGREKIVKKAKSKRAATILYNKIIKSDDYYEVGMRAIKEGKLKEGKKITLGDKGRKFTLDIENEAQMFLHRLKKDKKKLTLKNFSDYIDAEYKFFNSPKLNQQVYNHIKKNFSKLSETTLKESVWGLPKGSNTTKMDELDAELSRAGIKSIPDFTKLIVQVKGNKGKINKIMKTHKAKKIFEGKRQQLSIPVMDKLKTDKILKKLRLKLGKDYDVGVGSRNSFILDIEGKYLDKLITLLMKQRIRVR